MDPKELAKKALHEIEELSKALKIKLADTPPADPPMDPPAPVEGIVMSKDGKSYRIEGGAAVEGAAIFIQDTTGEQPAEDGTIELETGEILTIAGGKITKVEASPLPTPEETAVQMKALLATIDPTGQSKDPVHLMLKALMEYSFGWELREASQKATRDAAIAAYQTSLSEMGKKNEALEAEIKAIKDARTKHNEEISNAFEKMTTALKAIAEAPIGGPLPGGNKRVTTSLKKDRKPGGPLGRM